MENHDVDRAIASGPWQRLKATADVILSSQKNRPRKDSVMIGDLRVIDLEMARPE